MDKLRGFMILIIIGSCFTFLFLALTLGTRYEYYNYLETKCYVKEIRIDNQRCSCGFERNCMYIGYKDVCSETYEYAKKSLPSVGYSWACWYDKNSPNISRSYKPV